MVDKTALIYTDKFQIYNFGPQHPLRPLRIKLTYSLMEKLNLFNNERLEVFEPSLATQKEIERAHDPEYVEIVKKLSETPMDRSVQPYLYGLDFCIFNDIAVAIHHLKNLKNDIRIAYLDIDCHHGDGVQGFFYDDPNVLTISFHESGKFLFPGTGNTKEVGEGAGKGFSINFPLLPGTNNRMFRKLFRYCVPRILEAYAPDVLLTQLGADMYFGDPLTQMGLSISIYRDIAQTLYTSAHDYCQNKWIAVGGGGYLMTAVPRAWTLFLARMIDVELKNELPDEWVNQVKEEVPYETTPYLLWDRDDKAEIQLLSHPEIAKKMIDYNRELRALCDEEFIPNLKKKS
jgi:acetoin utilization protein AcuC